MMPDLVAAIFSRVSPKNAVWSSPMLQIIAASGAGITFVASNSPPIPTSQTTMSHALLAKYSKPIAVMSSNSVGLSASESASGRTYSVTSQSSSFEIIVPSTSMRSLKSMRYGEV